MRRVVLALCIAVLALLIEADERTHRYKDGEEVIVWMNKIGPYENPQETYSYYTLPFCKIDETKWDRKWAGLGEALEGNELVRGDFELQFKVGVAQRELCTKVLDESDAEMFDYTIENHYWYQMFVDELPVWGMVGETAAGEEKGHHDPTKHTGKEGFNVYTHRHFTFLYNDDRVIGVNLTSENPVLVQPGARLVFTYSIEWLPSDIAFSDRFNRYLDNDFFEHQIHWFSIFNSFMMVIFLTGLVSLILMRTLRNDYAKFARADEEDDFGRDMGDEFGWKQVQGDVFRFPPHTPLFAALVGTGMQLLAMIFCVVLIAIAGTLYIGRGGIITAVVVCYALTSFVAGYVSGSYYSQSKGPSWIKAMFLTCTLFPGLVVLLGLSLNTIAIIKQSLAAIPFGTMVVMVLIWALVSCPLTLVGTILGRNCVGAPSFPCRVNAIPRQIPDKKWYLKPWVVVILGGILPFGSIFIEMYFIFTSFWNYKFYYVYGFMLLVVVILVIVISCVSVVITYLLLNAEDYRWPWTCFLSSASTALYVFIYAVFYFLAKTRMYGFFQTAFYFGYTSMFCAGLAVMCGAIGFQSASVFVHRIYQNIKSD